MAVSSSSSSSSRFRKIARVPSLYAYANGTYYALVKRGGRQLRRSLRTTDFALAKRKLRDFLDRTEGLSSDHGRMPFEELARRWLAGIEGQQKPNSFRRRQVAVNGLMPFFKGVPIRNIGARQIENWKVRRGGKLSAQTWNIEVETLRLMLDYATTDLRALVENPAARIRRRRVRSVEREILTEAQFRALIGELRTGHRATGEAADFVEFLCYSGCRQAEAAEVRWVDVNFDAKTLRITGGDPGTKNLRHRHIPLFKPLERILGARRERARPDPEDRVFAIKSALLAVKRACERLGLPRAGHHTFRHMFCTHAVQAGVNFRVLAGWLGHSDGGALLAKTYSHLLPEHGRAMAERMTFDVGSGPDGSVSRSGD